MGKVIQLSNSKSKELKADLYEYLDIRNRLIEVAKLGRAIRLMQTELRRLKAKDLRLINGSAKAKD